MADSERPTTENGTAEKNLSFTALTALVVGSMIGAGIFSLPQNIAEKASAGAAMIGWLITGFGMLMLAFVFQMLSRRKPELDSGIYAYAKAGFGNYLGFNAVWGYWLAAWLGNVSYYVLVFGTLGYFFPIFGEGNTVAAIGAASLLLWSLCWMIARGIEEAAFINKLVTIAKIIPLLTFIVIMFTAFKMNIFTSDFWGTTTLVEGVNLGSVGEQVKNMMMVTVWVFIGIEGASLFSAKAKKRSDVGKATVVGFLFTLTLLMLINFLSMGVMAQPELATLKNPSTAYLLELVVGKWGATFISIGLIVSICGALLAWTLFCAEVLYSAAADHTMPAFLHKTNAKKVPINALLLSTTATQLFLIITYFSESTYTTLFYLATSMILLPYFFSAGYGLMVAKNKDGYDGAESNHKDVVVAAIAVIYSLWLLYAAGMQYFVLSALLYLPGVIFYIKARQERQATIFTTAEKIILGVIVVAALYAAYGLYTHKLMLA